MFANMKPFKNKIPLSRGKLLVNQVNSNKHHRCNESVTSEEELTTESIEETNLMAKKNKQTLEWVNSNDFKLKAANKNIITNELEATVLSNTIKPINTTDTTFKKERFKINPKNATFNVDETCKANETKMNSSELNTKKIENIFPNETQSANTIINSKMTTTSNFCLDDSNSEPSIYQYSSSSYVPSTTFSDHSSNYSEPDILIPNQNITPIRHIIHLDKNLVLNPNNNITSSQNNASSLNIDNYILQSLENKNNKKLKHRTICKFCKNNVTNFERHLERQHSNKPEHQAQSQTLLACAADTENTAAAIQLKNEVFLRMRADDIAFIAKKDDLIRRYGENYLKRHKRAQIVVPCSNKIRECAKLLKETRRRTNNNNLTFFDIISTCYYDIIVASAKTISRYDDTLKKYLAPSLAIHLGTTLKQISDLCSHLILKGAFKCNNIEEKLKDLKRFKQMVETQWNCDISSIALKDLAENKWNKPVKLPLTKDVLQLRHYLDQVANENFYILQKQTFDKKAFRTLTEVSLILTILFNRRRIGDVQYVYVDSYLKDFESFDQTEFLDALTDSEKVLTANYKKVVAGGKGSRAIVILFPKNVQTYINLLLNIRSNSDIVPKVNPYLFACPGVEKQWIRADVIIRKFANASGIENPEAISSNRLRKQIGTLMQILNLNKEEYAQFSKFMGHTEKTHAEFYEITQDAYQAAKVLKLLTLFDEGKGLEYKGKPLNEINLECINEIESDANTELNERQEEIAEQLPETSQEVVLQTNLDTEENKKMHRKKCNRVRWTQNQKNIVSKHFR
ncbi:hypothetical protein RN001_008892 [Aquatica leii]|uniref:Uncharacterized protein n=1 Tax=Aquatica leii TaxID=1421715 RepID=A0AAN7PHU9_9COLE|nr:hypothetical protein RN001_008892 [Aquatica leii]